MKQPLQPQHIWLLLKNCRAYKEAIRVFDTAAKAASDQAVQELSQFMKSGTANREDFWKEVDSQNLNATYWLDFLRKYSDVILLPVFPETDFSERVCFAVDTSPVRVVSPKLGSAIQQAFLSVDTQAGTDRFAVANWISSFEFIKKLRRKAQKAGESLPKVDGIFRELRGITTQGSKRAVGVKDARRLKRTVQEYGTYLPHQKITPATVLIDWSRNPRTLFDSLEQQIPFFPPSARLKSKSPLDKKCDFKKLELRVEVYRKYTDDKIDKSTIGRWLMIDERLPSEADAEKFIDRAIEVIAPLMTYLSR